MTVILALAVLFTMGCLFKDIKKEGLEDNKNQAMLFIGIVCVIGFIVGFLGLSQSTGFGFSNILFWFSGLVFVLSYLIVKLFLFISG